MMCQPTWSDLIPGQMGDLRLTGGTWQAWLTTDVVDGMGKFAGTASGDQHPMRANHAGPIADWAGNDGDAVSEAFDDFER
jgi:hypothetical protein